MEFPKRKHNRLSADLYCVPGAYFITICVSERQKLLWRNDKETLTHDIPLSEIGMIVQEHIIDIPSHYAGSIVVQKYVIMPNHVHILLSSHNADDRACPDIRQVIRAFKGSVSKHVGRSIWQKGFFDRIVRDMNEYDTIWKYIDENPIKWQLDKYYV